MKKSLITSIMAVSAALCLCVTAQAQGPVVTTDQPDYAPGTTAQFTATGFQPSELLDFSVAVADDSGLWVPDIAWADIAADSSGGASVQYVVPNTWAGKTLQLTVMGLTSGLMATTTFTDAAAANVNFFTNGLPAGTSVSVSWNGTNNGGNAVSGPTVFNAPGPSANTGLGQGTSLTYTFPATIVVGTNTYDLLGSAPTSPVTMPSGSPPIPDRTVTGTYQLRVVAVNHPPVITPLTANVDLGQIVGCLDGNGGFGTSVTVAYSKEAGADVNHFNVYATFNGDTNTKTLIATVYDQDGNLPLANIVATPSSDTLTFTGAGTQMLAYSTSVTATDTGTPPLSDTKTCPLAGSKVTVQIIYNFNGFFPPLDNNSVTLVKRGSTVPVKFQITDCSGNQITTGIQTISVAKLVPIVPSGAVDVSDAGASNDNGIDFRYDPTGMQWIYNLQTKTGYTVGCTYQITATLDDGTTHDVSIGMKK
jgi:hypothetical protein